MIATHRVRDKDGNTVGFYIDGSFYTAYRVRDSISLVDNLHLRNDGVIAAKKALPELDYKTDVIDKHFSKLVAQYPIKRDIQDDLHYWYKRNRGNVLQLNGARQVGKTTELLKFAYSHYTYVIYVDLVSGYGSTFIECMSINVDPLAIEQFCRLAKLPSFVNSRDTVLIIDEIQESSIIYNKIRSFERNLSCDVIVTGSYLGRVVTDSSWFVPAGVDLLTMHALSFREFCGVYNADKLLDNISLNSESDTSDYVKLESLYEVYRRIGGYPSVVAEYAKTNDIQSCYAVIDKLLEIFKVESRNYFENKGDTSAFDYIYNEALNLVCTRVDVYGKTIIDNLINTLSDNYKLLMDRKRVANAVMWVYHAGLLGVCDLVSDGDLRNPSPMRRLYFTDCGIMSYLGIRSKLDSTTLEGILTENFVFAELYKLAKLPFRRRRTLDDKILYGVSGAYELDFIMLDKDKVSYGIEVKTTDGGTKSLTVYLNRSYVDKGIIAKKTRGSIREKVSSIPVYTVGARFPYH